jgi:hypothetical protein
MNRMSSIYFPPKNVDRLSDEISTDGEVKTEGEVMRQVDGVVTRQIDTTTGNPVNVAQSTSPGPVQ